MCGAFTFLSHFPLSLPVALSFGQMFLLPLLARRLTCGAFACAGGVRLFLYRIMHKSVSIHTAQPDGSLGPPLSSHRMCVFSIPPCLYPSSSSSSRVRAPRRRTHTHKPHYPPPSFPPLYKAPTSPTTLPTHCGTVSDETLPPAAASVLLPRFGPPSSIEDMPRLPPLLLLQVLALLLPVCACLRSGGTHEW